MKRMKVTASQYTDKIDKMFEELVPFEGKADTVAGEIVRAACRIGGRWRNDGDQIGCGYGRETCNPAARYLIAKGDSNIKHDVESMWGETFLDMPDDEYDRKVEKLAADVCNYIESHPELKTTKNTEDMLNYATSEDYDDSWDDEEEDEW